jgi:NADH-quinone oxidoreductase subunit A
MNPYIPILIILVLAALLAAAILTLSRLAGRNRPSAGKLAPYECGVEPVGDARGRQSVKFYMVAMVFLLFDIEAVFLVPWAVAFPGVLDSSSPYYHLRFVFYGEMMLFMVVLFVGLVYIFRKRVIDWNL